MQFNKKLVLFIIIFLCSIQNVYSIDNSSIAKVLSGFDNISNRQSSKNKVIKKDSDFEKMLRFSQVRGKKDLYDEELIYEFLSAKYPAIKNPKIEKKVKKTVFYGDSQSNSEFMMSQTYLINKYKKNPALLNQEYFKQQVRNYWYNKIFSNSNDEKIFLDIFGRIFNAHDYEIKLEKILWSGDISKVRNMQTILNKVSLNSRMKAKLRLDIQTSENIDELFKKFNKFDVQLNDNGASKQILLFDAIQWCRKNHMDEEAIKLLDIIPLKNRIENEKWITLIKPFLRTALATHNMNNYNIAYKIASNHNLESNKIEYVDMEFFAGFIASEFLNKKDIALTHFMNSYKNAKQDFRRSRGAYWVAHCQKSQKSQEKIHSEKLQKLQHKAKAQDKNLKQEKDLKNKYLLIASQEFTTFYGQLALKELNNMNILKKYFVKTSQSDLESLSKHPLFKYYYFSLKSRNINLSKKVAKIFTLSLKSKNEVVLLAQIANAMQTPEISVYIGNIAMYNMSYIALEALYPIPNYKNLNFNPPLNLAIIKRESNFDSGLISNAGSRGNAHGLMQIIPGTGFEIAKKMHGNESNYNHHSLLDSSVNIKYGNFWIGYLSKKYNNSELLISAAYNGGSGSVGKWIKLLGDPREFNNLSDKNIKIANWVEQIPFRETRYYVQSVLSTMMIYQAMMNFNKS